MSKLIPLFFVALALAIAAALFMRPGTLVSVSDEALATSIARGADAEAGGCHHRGERWTCTDGDSRIYRASVGDYGCWEAVRVDAGGRIVSLEPVSGCVDLADVLSIGG